MHGIEILRWNGFRSTPLFATTAPPPRAWTEGGIQGGFSDNCGWLEVILSGTFTNVLVCSHHSQWLLKHRLSSSWWCVILTLDAGRQDEAVAKTEREREREDGPAQALEQTASQNAGDYRSLHCGPLNPKNTSQAAVPEKYSEGSLLIVPLSTENWFRFSFESVFLEKYWLPLCDKLCSLNTSIVHSVYESYIFLLFIFALFYKI